MAKEKDKAKDYLLYRVALCWPVVCRWRGMETEREVELETEQEAEQE